MHYIHDHLANGCITVQFVIRELKQRRRRRQRERQKSKSKTATLHVHHAFLYISLTLLHDYNVKVPKFTFCKRTGTQDNNFLFLFLNFDNSEKSFRIQLQKNFPTFDEVNEM